ncbi:hypothetical protein TGS27_1541 [Geobacillus stearothermophilus]|uniref:Uncharacterized protein n=1 Tax=Geobacillus stearothermophilus TaxID=1422 RepID=A0A150ND77_GEOSE|nr:hypothetical protein B4114_0299 [Geobacillus stearothermophilus]OAO81795.1 hypothetical protein TGS27_1541 [Geobacillus stearothermophilus]
MLTTRNQRTAVSFRFILQHHEQAPHTKMNIAPSPPIRWKRGDVFL